MNQQQAAVMVILVLITAPLAFLSTANQVSTLAFVRGAEFLATTLPRYYMIRLQQTTHD